MNTNLRQCLRLTSTKTSRDTASIEFEPPGRLPGEWLREAGRGWKVSDKFLRERLTVNSDLWVASSPSNDIIELEDPHVPFPDSALTTFAADHSRGLTPYGLIISQGETGPQKRREPRYALQFIKITYFIFETNQQRKYYLSFWGTDEIEDKYNFFRSTKSLNYMSNAVEEVNINPIDALDGEETLTKKRRIF
ncbi:hypothetical protein OUZ56_001075 [Daphnia magna]|uniref:Uncharacterized protein n=1 Tax=Daphnia magna TaxID=35525 RepID=A0ABR0A1J9_9CRUS|nr:hypothetical protein OUZ56_001075 [Daphnia magna]